MKYAVDRKLNLFWQSFTKDKLWRFIYQYSTCIKMLLVIQIINPVINYIG